MNLNKWIALFSNLFLENNCRLCFSRLLDDQNKICLSCILDLPFTTVNTKINSLRNFGFIEQHFSLLHYRKQTNVSKILTELKYKSNPHITNHLIHTFAYSLGKELLEYDALVPIPLHYSKLKFRGYNQAEHIADQLAMNKSIVVKKLLTRPKPNRIQAKLNRLERWRNSENIFTLSGSLDSIHRVLLVDDVCTTGATLVSAATVLKKAKNTLRIDVLVLCQGD